MSMQFSVAFKQDRWPSADAIIAKASEYGFSIGVPDLMESAPPPIPGLSGPSDLIGKFQGQTTGFLFEFSDATEHHDLADALEMSVEEMFGDRDTVLTMQESMDPDGIQMALVVAAAIVELADGVFFDDFDNVDTSPDRILDEVRSFDEDESEEE